MTRIFNPARPCDSAQMCGAHSRFRCRLPAAWLRACGAIALLLICGLLQAQDAIPEPLPDEGAVDSGYQLGPRDRISVTVFNHPDLSGEYLLDGEGRFSMPLIGVVDASGRTPVELKEVLIERFKPDYLVDPRVSIEVRNYRPYYLIGEVRGTTPKPQNP